MTVVHPSSKVIILHGNDEVGMQAIIARVVTGLGDPTIAGMNVSRLDGAAATLDDIANAAGTAPFLAPYRLAVISELPRQDYNDSPRSRFLDRLGKDESGRTKLLNYLSALPETGRVVLAVDDELLKKGGWSLLKDNHWLVKWVQKNPGLAEIVPVAEPSPADMTAWIMDKARDMGGRFSKAAAAELVSHVDTHTRLAEMEIGKLLDYVNYARTVEQEDVQRLVTYSGEVSIFDMIDAMAEGNTGKAVHLLNVLLEKDEPEQVFGMLVRHFRLLLAVREIIDEGGRPKQILEELGGDPFKVRAPFVAEKLYRQAGRYSLLRLEDIYRRMPDLSVAVRQKDGLTELTAFIAGLAQPGH